MSIRAKTSLKEKRRNMYKEQVMNVYHAIDSLKKAVRALENSELDDERKEIHLSDAGDHIVDALYNLKDIIKYP